MVLCAVAASFWWCCVFSMFVTAIACNDKAQASLFVSAQQQNKLTWWGGSVLQQQGQAAALLLCQVFESCAWNVNEWMIGSKEAARAQNAFF
jgi:hypothetical protein